MAESKWFVVTWIAVDGLEYEKSAYAENPHKANYKAFKALRDEDGAFDRKANFEWFLRYAFKSVKPYVRVADMGKEVE